MGETTKWKVGDCATYIGTMRPVVILEVVDDEWYICADEDGRREAYCAEWLANRVVSGPCVSAWVKKR